MLPIRKIKVLVVDDSPIFRESLVHELNEDSHIEVVGVATDTADAMKKIEALSPNVVTIDVEMQKENGIDFIKRLLAVQFVPVVVVSPQAIDTLEALDAGAVDFVNKPKTDSPNVFRSFMRELSIKIKIASSTRPHKKDVASSPLPSGGGCQKKDTLIAIGASTGGTEAILSVIKELPADTPPVVIVQHMPPIFTNMYAERVDKLSKMHVKEAEHMERLENGKILIAAGDKHLTVHKDSKGYYVKSQHGEKVSGHCPSVNVLFNSVAALGCKNTIGVILTGMGSDGADGLLKMRQSGAYTIGQNKETCVVYGMPMVAYNIGAVTKQLPLGSITNEIINTLNKIK